jgi:hypothetical protein
VRRRNHGTISPPNLPSTDTDEIIQETQEKKEAPRSAKKREERKEAQRKKHTPPISPADARLQLKNYEIIN